MPRVSFHTLGCKLNFAETSTVARQFASAGYDVVEFGEAADVTVINTCSVTQEADRKCRQTVRRALRQNPDAFVVVTGCYAQLQPRRLAEIDGVDAVFGTNEKFSLLDLVSDFSRKREQTQVDVSCIDTAQGFQPAYSTADRTRAFLKVQDGCDYVCSFCTIPTARGRSRSATIEQCVAQSRDLAERGFCEVVLSGVNIGLFGADTGSSLLALLRELDRIDGIERFRISSIEPNLLSNEIISFVAESRRFQPHFHVPLQSGDDVVLGRMRRRYRTSLYRDRVHHIKELMPHACVGVDVIVGFPAETEERFRSTHTFLADLPVSYLHVFTYSERENAPLVRGDARVDGFQDVPVSERSRRNRVLRSLSARKLRTFYDEHRGSTRPVLWETETADGFQFGFTDNYIRLRRPADPTLTGHVTPAILGPFVEPSVLAAESELPIELPLA